MRRNTHLPKHFYRAIVRWMHTAGIRRCYVCGLWKQGRHRSRPCTECASRLERERYLRRRDGRDASFGIGEPANDWHAKANAYFASQIDPTYYTDLRLKQASSLGRIA
jgi:hypothetical protein